MPVVNWASEIVRQEGTVSLSLATGGTITANDTATITIQGTAYTYTEKSSDTLDGITPGFGQIHQRVRSERDGQLRAEPEPPRFT